MTETLSRPRPQPAVTSAETRPVRLWSGAIRAALRAAVGGLLISVVLVLVVWLAESRSGSGVLDALRASGLLWLVAHGAGLRSSDGSVQLTLVPLGLCLLPLALLGRAGWVAARECGTSTLRGAAFLAAVVTPLYVGVGVAVSTVSRLGDVRAPLLTTVLAIAAIAALGSFLGAAAPQQLLRERFTAASPTVRASLSGVALMIGVLLAGGSLLAALGTALHLPKAAELASATDPGVLGGGALLLTGLSLLPNAAVAAACWLTGSGFAVGAGSYGPFGVEAGPAPALPLLAGLPSTTPPIWLAVALLAVPVLAGLVAARPVVRAAAGRRRAARSSAALALGSGVVVGALVWLAGGALGSGPLADVGGDPLQVGATLAGQVALGGAVATLLARRSETEAVPASGDAAPTS